MNTHRNHLNFRDHIRPLIIADTVLSLGIVLLIVVWMFGDQAQTLGGLVFEYKSLLLGAGIGLTLGGGIMLLNAVLSLLRARRSPY